MKPRKLVCGVGINDADYPVYKTENGKQVCCPYYRKWKNMLQRGYYDKFKQKNPAYQDVAVCKEWHSFMNFRSWMMEQDWKGKELDKDFLVQGNKEYSPTTCVFVDSVTNSFMNEQAAARSEWPLGCYLDERVQKFQSKCRNPFSKKNEHLGLFTCPQQAHSAWRKRKHELAFQIADLQTDQRVADALRQRYNLV